MGADPPFVLPPKLLDRITGRGSLIASGRELSLLGLGEIPGHVDRLRVPNAELKEYEKTLDRIIEKLRQVRLLDTTRLSDS